MSCYSNLRTERFNNWFVMSGQGNGGLWTAWAKTETMVSDSPLKEPGEVYFEFGKSRDEAIKNLVDADLGAVH